MQFSNYVSYRENKIEQIHAELLVDILNVFLAKQFLNQQNIISWEINLHEQSPHLFLVNILLNKKIAKI